MEEPELEEDGDRAERGSPDPRKDWDWKGIRGAGDRQGEGRGGGFRPEAEAREQAGSEGGAGVGQDRASPEGAEAASAFEISLTEWAGVARLG